MTRRKPVNSKTKFRDNITVVGFDPGVNHTGVCVLDKGTVCGAQVVTRGPDNLVDPRYAMAAGLAMEVEFLYQSHHKIDLVVIEWQAWRPHDPRPNDIVELMSVCGMILGLCAYHNLNVLRPLPVQWKGSVPKKIHLPRIMACSGATSQNFEGISPSLQEHAIDALGLAIWGAQL